MTDEAQQTDDHLTTMTPELLDQRRMIEAILFAADRALGVAEIADRLPDGIDVAAHIDALVDDYANRGVILAAVAGKWQFRTAPDLSFLLRKEVEEARRLSRAAVETLAIIAYHQPVTRAEIEEIRGVGLSKGTLDVLMAAGWIRPRGRRKTPGRPLMYGTSEDFLVHFGLEDIKDLPGLSDLQAAGLLDGVDEAMEKLAQEQAEQAARQADEQIDLEEVIEASVEADALDLDALDPSDMVPSDHSEGADSSELIKEDDA